MIKPTIHLNGSSPESLREGYRKAAEALYDAISALCEAGPHGRDYYLQSNTAIYEAVAEHASRVDRLKSVQDELVQLAEHVQEQIDERDHSRAMRQGVRR